VPPITLDPRLPQPLNDAILIAVSKDPNARFQTAAAFRNALGSVAAMIQAPTTPVAAPKAAAAVPVAAPKAAAASAMPPHAIATAPKSKRWLWMAIGGVAAAAAIVGAIELAPWKPTRAAAPTQQTSTAQAQPSTPPADATPAQSAPPQDAVPAPVTLPESTPQAAPVQTPAAFKSPARRAPDTASASHAVTTPQEQPIQQQPAVSAPVPQPQQQQQPQTVAPPSVPAGPSPAEVLHAREHFAKLQVRATTIHDSLANMKRTMQSQGMSLNAKFTRPEALMDTYLQSAENALNSSDLAAAKEYGDKAERQIEILEKLFNQ
jgi:serine/threonine-protein kinase